MLRVSNGVLAAQTSASGSIGINHVPLGIGENLDDFSDYFHGSIDDVQIYDRSFNQTQIQQVYEAPY